MNNKLITIPLLLILNQAYADIPSSAAQIPNLFDPGRVERYLRSTALPPAKAEAKPIEEKKPATVPQTEKIKFKLTRIIFLSNTVYPSSQLETIFAPDINKEISLKELQDRVDDVTKKYRAAGYILSRAILPPQEIKNGVVKVQVIEGFISKITVQGNPGRSRCYLECYGYCIMASKPLQIQRLERDLLLANDLPGLKVSSVITPSPNIPASADLTLVTDRKVGSSYIMYNNYNTRYLGPQQYYWGADVNSLVFPGSDDAVNFATSQKNTQLKYGEYVHTQALGCDGLKWTLGGNYTETRPGFLLGELDIVGRSLAIYSNLIYPIIRSREQNLYIHGGANYQNVTSTILDTPFYQDRIRYISLGGSYDGVDKKLGYNSVDFTLVQGLDIFGAHQHFFQSRPLGNSNYLRADLNLSRLQSFESSNFSIFIAIQGQYAFDALLATEQYGYGGPLFGRGYGPSEIVGDHGLAGKGELRYQVSPEARFLKEIQYYAFYDAGSIWNIDTVNLPNKQSATSTGAGARINFMQNLSGEFYLARPLTFKANTLTPPDQNPYQWRGFFQLVARM